MKTVMYVIGSPSFIPYLLQSLFLGRFYGYYGYSCLLVLSVSVYYFQDKDEGYGEEKITARDRIMAGCLKCVDMLCVWDCCWCWVRIQEIFALIVFDPFMELFITLCIVVNTLFMAMDHHDMDPDFEKVLKAGNYVSCLVKGNIIGNGLYSFSQQPLPSKPLSSC